MFYDFDRSFADYEERLMLGLEAPWSASEGCDPPGREALRVKARGLQSAEMRRWFGAFWRGLTGRG